MCAGFLFLMYLSDKLAGHLQYQLWLQILIPEGRGLRIWLLIPFLDLPPIGTTMSDIFANFTLAVSIDSGQGAFGFSNLDFECWLYCYYVCKAQMS